MRRSYIIILITIVISFIIGFYFYPKMPLQMVSHWNMHGEPDGFMLKIWGLFLTPIISLILFLMFILIPKIDPLKENVEKFRKYFDGFVTLIIVFLFYVYVLTVLWNTGTYFDMVKLMILPIAALFYFTGVFIGKTKRNFFIGIRTPWTLSSDVVWDKTHKIGGKLFKISGIIGLLGIFFGSNAFYFILIPAIFSAIFTAIYSYFEYQRIKKNGKKEDLRG